MQAFLIVRNAHLIIVKLEFSKLLVPTFYLCIIGTKKVNINQIDPCIQNQIAEIATYCSSKHKLQKKMHQLVVSRTAI
jgi:hypothetical protein